MFFKVIYEGKRDMWAHTFEMYILMTYRYVSFKYCNQKSFASLFFSINSIGQIRAKQTMLGKIFFKRKLVFLTKNLHVTHLIR